MLTLSRRRQAGEHEPADLRIASHVAADEFGGFAAAAHAGDLEALGEDPRQFLAIVHRYVSGGRCP